MIGAPPGTSVGEKRNIALSHARGDVIAWFDDDDWQHPARLSMLMAALEGGAWAAGAVCSWFINLDTSYSHLYDRSSAVLFNGLGLRRELATRVSFDPRLPRASDTPWVREVLALARGYVTALDAPLSLWLSHGRNLSNPANKRRFSVPPATLARTIGPAWDGTEAELDALRARLSPSAAAPPRPAPAPEVERGPAPGALRMLARPRSAALRRVLDALAEVAPGQPEGGTLSSNTALSSNAALTLAISPREIDLAQAPRTVVLLTDTEMSPVMRRALGRVAATVVVSEALAAWLVRKGLKRPDAVISLGFDPDVPLRGPLEPVFTLGLHGADAGAAQPGVMDRAGRSIAGRSLFGADQIIAIAARLVGAPLRFRMEPRYSSDGDLATRLRALGFEVEVADKPGSWLPCLDALLVASQHEGGPAEALDALAAGVPVISRPQGEMLTLSEHLWDTPEQAEAHVRALLEDREGGLAGAAARRASVEGHTPAAAARALAAVIERHRRARVPHRGGGRPLVRGVAPAVAAPAARAAALPVTHRALPPSPQSYKQEWSARRVSVLMSAFRTGPWIEEAAASMLCQALPPGWSLELLIGVDDCPATLEVARRISDRRVIVFDLGVNGGTYRALNTLLSFARGDVITIMDSDDIAEPGRLLATLGRLMAPDAPGLVGGQFVAITEDGRPCSPVSALAADPSEGFRIAERCFLMAHGTLSVRREVYDALGGYDDTRVSGDADLIVRALAAGWKGVTLPEPLLRYRQRRAQLTRAPESRRGSGMRASYEADLNRRWARYRAGEAPERIHAPVRAPVRAVYRSCAARVQVVMPTIPPRLSGARRVIERLLDQEVSRMVVLLNGHRGAEGLPTDPRLVYRVNPPGTGPAVRLDEAAPDQDVVFFVDDDLIYPSDYISQTLRHLDALGPGCAVSYHVARWPPGSTGYSERKLTFYSDAVQSAFEASYVGIGVSATPARLLPLLQGRRPPIFEINDDLWYSAHLRRAGVRLVRPESPGGWITATALANGPDALYRQAAADRFRVRNEAINYAREVLGWRMEEQGTQR